MTATLEELITTYITAEETTLWLNLLKGQCALDAKRQHGVSYSKFAQACGACEQTMREYAGVAAFYEQVDLKDLFDGTTLQYSHLMQAKRGFNGKWEGEELSDALDRLEDWIERGISPTAARLEMDKEMGSAQPPMQLVEEWQGNVIELDVWLRRLNLNVNKRYRFAIYEVE